MSTPIRVKSSPWSSYTLEVKPLGTAENPYVSIAAFDNEGRTFLTSHDLTPDQARTLARDLVAAADGWDGVGVVLAVLGQDGPCRIDPWSTRCDHESPCPPAVAR